MGVVTINCARLGYLFKHDKEHLYERLSYLLELAKTSLEIKRKEIQRHIDGGLFPYTKRYLGTLRNHFSTIGVNGINEMIRNFTDDKEDITTEAGHAFALEFLDYVRAKLVSFRKKRIICTTWRQRQPKARRTVLPRKTRSASRRSFKQGRPRILITPTVLSFP